MQNGIFTISLDFELHWGVFPARSIQEYEANLAGTYQAVEQLLQLFEEYKLHVTWATVGLLFFENKKELQAYLPKAIPNYTNTTFSPYPFIANLEDAYNHPYHFAKSLIEKIRQYPNQEIGTHTFSHYYCLEEGQTIADFKADLEKAVEAARLQGLTISSIVFPRNQFNQSYLNVCKELKINYIRGNPKHFIYKGRKRSEENLFIRFLRLMDNYINLSGHQVVMPKLNNGLVEIPYSRFLRPYHSKLSGFDTLKLNRIKNEMTAAAKEKKLYHLWWHPHNFGTHIEENMAMLKTIVKHYFFLKDTYNFQSLNMEEIGVRILSKSFSNF